MKGETVSVQNKKKKVLEFIDNHGSFAMRRREEGQVTSHVCVPTVGKKARIDDKERKSSEKVECHLTRPIRPGIVLKKTV